MATDFYAVTTLIEMPDGLGPRSAAIAKMQPAIEAFRTALQKAGFEPQISERISRPSGPRPAKAVLTPILPGAAEVGRG